MKLRRSSLPNAQYVGNLKYRNNMHTSLECPETRAKVSHMQKGVGSPEAVSSMQATIGFIALNYPLPS